MKMIEDKYLWKVLKCPFCDDRRLQGCDSAVFFLLNKGHPLCL